MNDKILKFIPKRNDIFIKNKYEILNNYDSNDDFHIVLYFLEKNKCKIIIRRLDEESGWGLNLTIKLYSLNDVDIYEKISIGNSENNLKIINYTTKIDLDGVIYEKQKIPKKIYQTSYDNKYVSLLHYNSLQTFLELNPEYEYYFYDDNDCRKFIKNNFDKEVLDAFDLLYPGAYKADLFRYCCIYIKGGCYFDNKYILRIPLRELINSDYENIYCKDTKDELMFNSIIMSIKKCDELKNCIDQIVKNVKNRFYGLCPLSPTGPRLFNTYTNNKNILLKHEITGKYYFQSKVLIKDTMKLFLNTHYKGYYNQNIKNYNTLFLDKEIYYSDIIKDNNYIILIFPNFFDDKFSIKIVQNNIYIKRIDSNSGWDINLKIKILKEDDDNYENIIEIGSSKKNEIYLNF
jgi:mannosyltransferase OCH1-like enzyme